MIAKIPKQRINKSNGKKPFEDLVNYSIETLEKIKQKDIEFEHIINYETAHVNKDFKQKCIATRIHGITNIENASIQMAAVAAENTKCKDPAYHFILSWPEFEKPNPEKMFDAAEHAIRSLGLGEHQYVIAIHADTDNMHCHIAVNRVNPITFKSKHIEWSVKTLHMAARQSEIKNGWFHDNGYYVVQANEQGKKTIALNQKFVEKDIEAGEDPYFKENITLPSWHDPESLETWLKSFVSKNLKRDIKSIQSWYGLHAWLDQYGITLTNTGGGMRLTVASTDTGEILEVAASRGLRILKKSELEQRWGGFRKADNFDLTQNIPDFSNISKTTLQQGVENVLKQAPDYGNPPPAHIINAHRDRQNITATETNRMPGMPTGNVDDGRQRIEMLVQNHVHDDLDILKAGKDNNVRWSGDGEKGNGQRRVSAKREEQKQYRAALRADLRKRYGQYKRYTRGLDTGYWASLKDLKAIRKQELVTLNQEKSEAISTVNRYDPKFLTELSLINNEYTNKKLEIESHYQDELRKLNEIRVPPLGWRVWLHEQAQLGDQAALSALRGIVYQAKRDAKYSEEALNEDESITIQESHEDIKKDDYFRRLLKRLYEEEQQEIAIRAARLDMMRPHEIDAIIVQYKKISWYITGNGNIEYSSTSGDFLFTDRGNRVTFDREIVSDDDIRMALLHASRKFGNQIVLTGTDDIFTRRMARLAMELNLTVVNPELQDAVQEIKTETSQKIIQDIVNITVPDINFDSLKEFGERVIRSQADAELLDPVENMKAKVLSIVPNAKFEMADTGSNKNYTGTVFFRLEDNSGFVQHNGRDKFIIHKAHLTIDEPVSIDIKYRNNKVIISKTKGIIKDVK